MEPNGDKESVKEHIIRFFKWNRMFQNVRNGLLPECGVMVYHAKITTLQSSGVFHSTDDYMAFFLSTSHFFTRPRTAEFFLRKQLENMNFSSHTKEILVKDICAYIFGCFKLEPGMFQLAQCRPVIVSDIFLTRQKGGEDLAHVGKRRKVAYMCNFKDIDAAIKKYICERSRYIKLVREEVQTENKGLVQIFSALKEMNYQSKTNDSTCSICLDEYEKEEQLMVGPCSHMFHRSCLLKWLPRPCPMCRGCLTKEVTM